MRDVRPGARMNRLAAASRRRPRALKGSLVRLRPVTRRDLTLLVAWRTHPETRRCFFSVRPPTVRGQDAWFRTLAANRDTQLFIVETKDALPVGTIGLDRIDRDHRAAEFGAMLIGNPRFRGKGYGTDAARTLISFAFNTLGLNRLTLEVFAWNAPAIRLYRRCGFAKEGVLRRSRFSGGAFRDTVLMSLLREEFRRRGNARAAFAALTPGPPQRGGVSRASRRR